MKQTFFESMGIAGLEKIHTQFIEWIIKNDNIATDVKFKLVEKMVGKKVQPFSDGDPLYVVTEFSSIDLLIRMGNNLIVIENKLSSSQHDNQLQRYEEIIADNLNAKKKNKFFVDLDGTNIHYILLELIGEKAESEKWSCVLYRKWHDIMLTIRGDLTSNSKEDIIIEDYIDTLKNMVDNIDMVLTNPQNYQSVFMEKKRKSIKYFLAQNNTYYKTDVEKYIATQNMETIVQKAFLYKLAEFIKPKGVFKITESNGTALLEIEHRVLMSHDEAYMIGIQFQNDDAKIIYRHADDKKYRASSKKNIPTSIKDFLEKLPLNGNMNEGTTYEWYAITTKIQKYYEIPYEKSCVVYQDKYNEFVELIDEHICILTNNPDWHER